MKKPIITDELIYTWELFPQMIQWHQHHRQFIDPSLPGHPVNHINALLIMSSAVMIEGAINSLLSFYINGHFSPYSSALSIHDEVSLLNERNKKFLSERIISATWKDYKKLFNIVTGKNLSELIGSAWEPTCNLFEFRNLLSHGEQLQIKGEWDRNDGLALLSLERSKEKLFRYLESQNLIIKPEFGKYIGWSFLSNEIADHLVVIAREFLYKLSENAPDNEFEETLPKKIKAVLETTKLPTSENIENFYAITSNV